MILEKLRLRNFGLFRGIQEFNLAPAERHGKHRPIVLFGAINGGGKTTLFDALQLALYGPRARCAKRANLSYDDFLRGSIHQGVAPDEGAGVWLSFRYVQDGIEHDYEVRRDWETQQDKMHESVTVYDDGLPNYSLSRSWAQRVEELLPLEISQLFFFDGEKIRTLAEDASRSEALGTAIKALLGLDLVERLIADANILQTRLTKQALSGDERAALEEVEEAHRDQQSQLMQLRSDQACLQNDLERAANDLAAAQKAFAAEGGRHWDERRHRDQRLIELKARIEHTKARLLSLAAGELPLAMVPELLEAVRERQEREQKQSEAEVTGRLLEKRDRALLAFLKKKRASAELVQQVKEHLEADRKARRPAHSAHSRLGLSEHARTLLGRLPSRVPELVSEAREAVDEHSVLEQEREDVERGLEATPEEGEIKELMQRLQEATQRNALLEDQSKRLERDVETKNVEVERARRQVEAKVKKEFAEEDARHMAELAARTRETMQEFLRRATARKIDRLSHLITESFRFLLRKQTLVERIFIDPSGFAVTLFDSQGNALPRQRLSEGEKQIFAISLLWGLARASARPLPAVIDTPMARLDATHRLHLVERYFPNASHQVVILSTDTEVDREYYGRLQPSIARAYNLSYDEQLRVTVGEEGYFWKPEAAAPR
jgi:DNA sulfur modification protein DndD